MFSEARDDGGASSHLPAVPCTYNQNVLCGLEGYVDDLINFGAKPETGQVSPAVWLGACNSTTSINEKGWDQQGLRKFLTYLDKRGVRSLDIWTSGARPQTANYCPWEIEELERWMGAKTVDS